MSLQPASHNFTIWKGATFRNHIVLLQGDVGTAPRDLTGYTATMNIVDISSGATLVALTSSSGITFGGTLGTIDLFIAAATTSNFTWTQGRYVLFITAPAGDTDPLLHGTVKVVSL